VIQTVAFAVKHCGDVLFGDLYHSLLFVVHFCWPPWCLWSSISLVCCHYHFGILLSLCVIHSLIVFSTALIVLFCICLSFCCCICSVVCRCLCTCIFDICGKFCIDMFCWYLMLMTFCAFCGYLFVIFSFIICLSISVICLFICCAFNLFSVDGDICISIWLCLMMTL